MRAISVQYCVRYSFALLDAKLYSRSEWFIMLLCLQFKRNVHLPSVGLRNPVDVAERDIILLEPELDGVADNIELLRKGRLRLSCVGTDSGASVPTPPLPLSRSCGSFRIPRQGKPNNLLSIMELLSDIVYWALYAFFFGGCILILGAQIIRDTIELAKDFHDVNREETDEEEQI